MKANRLVIIVILLLHGLSTYSIGLWMINTGNLPNLSRYEELLDFAGQNEQYISSFIPDEYWKSTYSRKQFTDKLVTLYELLCQESNDPDNQDLWLLKGLVCHYLYNLDQLQYGQTAISNYNNVSDLPGHDYRFKWMLGIHYAKAARPFEAIEQFSFVADRIAEDQLHPLFWKDFGYAAFLALMPAKAMNYFELAAKYGKQKLEDNSIYENIKENIIAPPVGEAINKEDLYKAYERKEGLGLLSRALGIWIPIEKSWKLTMKDYTDNKSLLFITPDSIKSKGGQEVSYTIALFFIANDGQIEDEWMKSYPDYQLTDDLELAGNYRVYEYKDPNVYANMGGSHGYVAFSASSYPSRPGESIEAPSKFYWPETKKIVSSNDSGSGSYIPLNKEFSRLRGSLHYVFLLDTSNLIFEESKQEFIRFLKGVIIE